jgi:hypothetical protein
MSFVDPIPTWQLEEHLQKSERSLEMPEETQNLNLYHGGKNT